MTLTVRNTPAVDAAMSAASALLGMEIVFIGGLTEDTFTFERVHATAEWPGVREGVSSPRHDTLCHQLLAGAPTCTTDALQDQHYRQAAKTAELGIRSYVGVPVHDDQGTVVATLCGIDRGVVMVDEDSMEVLTALAEVISAELGALVREGVVIRRGAGGSWSVDDHSAGDLTSAMVLADLLAADLSPGARPPRHDASDDEVSRLRVSVAQLEHALAARVVIEQAIGVLAERQHTGPRQAFERLRKVARSRGRKVHDLAREVVLSSGDQRVPLPPELAGPR